jgi:hypothetical protein
MEHIVSCCESNGAVKVEPDPLHVNPGDTVRWKNQLPETYRVTNFSPDSPPLFGSEAIEIPAGTTSTPATVATSPDRGPSLPYHYSLVPTQGGALIDPVIIVDSPGNPPR